MPSICPLGNYGMSSWCTRLLLRLRGCIESIYDWKEGSSQGLRCLLNNQLESVFSFKDWICGLGLNMRVFFVES